MPEQTEPLAPEEEVEQARDSLIEEAIIAFFILSALSDDGEGAELDQAIENWTIRSARRLWRLYYGYARNLSGFVEDALAPSGIRDRDLRTSTPDDPDIRELDPFTPSKDIIRTMKTVIKALRVPLKEKVQAKQKGQDSSGTLTPDAAGTATANTLTGLVSLEVADALGLTLDGYKIRKTWWSRADGRVRSLHLRLHGRTKAVGKDFWRWPATGERLAYPGDMRAPVEATANCRCFLLLSAEKV